MPAPTWRLLLRELRGKLCQATRACARVVIQRMKWDSIRVPLRSSDVVSAQRYVNIPKRLRMVNRRSVVASETLEKESKIFRYKFHLKKKKCIRTIIRLSDNQSGVNVKDLQSQTFYNAEKEQHVDGFSWIGYRRGRNPLRVLWKFGK